MPHFLLALCMWEPFWYLHFNLPYVDQAMEAVWLDEEAGRFNYSLETVKQWHAFGETHHRWLQVNRPPNWMLDVDEICAWDEYIETVRMRTAAWEAVWILKYASRELYVATRAQYLENLRAILGDEWYFAGYLPPPCDLRFMQKE